MFIYLFLRHTLTHTHTHTHTQAWAGEGKETGRHRIWSKLKALRCQHRARHGAWTHKPWPELKSMLNQLSYPGSLRVWDFLKSVNSFMPLGSHALHFTIDALNRGELGVLLHLSKGPYLFHGVNWALGEWSSKMQHWFPDFNAELHWTGQ